MLASVSSAWRSRSGAASEVPASGEPTNSAWRTGSADASRNSQAMTRPPRLWPTKSSSAVQGTSASRSASAFSQGATDSVGWSKASTALYSPPRVSRSNSA